MKENSKNRESEKEKKEEIEEDLTEEEESDFKFHDALPDMKDVTPLFKPSDLEQFISAEVIPTEKKTEDDKDKEKREKIKYSSIDYIPSKNLEWREQDMIADVDDLRRIGMMVEKRPTEFRHDFSAAKPKIEMPELPEMRDSGMSDESREDIVKYAGNKSDVWREEFGSIHKRDLKKYRREG